MELTTLVLGAFYFVILIFSIIIHEVSHGLVALWLGDSTAKYSGRLTLNPISHIDIWGSIIVPLFMIISTGFAFGWAKPVPYNPYNLKNQKWGPLMVALGGPGLNIAIALLAAFIAKMIAIPVSVKLAIMQGFNDWSNLSSVLAGSVGSIFYEILILIIFWNVLLAFFNLIPFPPLDGSKVLFTFLNIKTETMILLEQYGFLLLLFFILMFGDLLGRFLRLMLMLFFNLAI